MQRTFLPKLIRKVLHEPESSDHVYEDLEKLNPNLASYMDSAQEHIDRVNARRLAEKLKTN